MQKKASKLGRIDGQNPEIGDFLKQEKLVQPGLNLTKVEATQAEVREGSAQAMSMGPVTTSVFKPKAKHNYPPELEPYRQQLEQWVEARRSLLAYFMDRQDQDFEIVYGDWFWYKPGKKNTICMGVLAFKQALDLYKDELAEGLLTLDQIMFALLHEMAHMKTTREGNRAGLKFILDHFLKYLARKKIESADQQGEYIALNSTYFNFYNILEDCVVNRMVLNTPWYGDVRSQNSIKNLYVGPFFQLYRPATDGNFLEEINPLTGQAKVRKIKPGEKGTLAALTEKDYQDGFQTDQLYQRNEPGKTNLAGDFLTYFIKSQMGVMPVDAFYDGQKYPKQANSRYQVASEIAACFNEKIPQLYEKLLSQVIQKYAGDKEKLSRYVDFMAMTNKVSTYRMENRKVVEGEPAVYYNVIPPNAAKPVAGGDLFLAVNIFKQGLAKLPIVGLDKMTLPQMFAEFKRLKSGRDIKGNTIPFSYTYVERTHMIRKAIEPIFSLLCLLDDSFNVNLPEQTMEHGEGEHDDAESDETQELDPNDVFTEGREVEVNDPDNPNHGRRGIITKVRRNGKEVISVEIDYFEEVQETKMVTVVNGRDVELTGEKEEFTDFVDKLIVIAKKKKAGSGKSPKNPKKIQTKAMEEEDDENGDEGKGEGETEGDESEGGKNKPADPSADLPKELREFAEQVRQTLEEQEKDENKKNVEEAMNALDYKKKREQQEEKARLKKALEQKQKAKRPKGSKGVPVQTVPKLQDDQVNELITELHTLEETLQPYMDAMAREWLSVVENVAAEIYSFKDRFYREGKINIKRLQKYFPEIEYGQQVEDRLVKEKIVERIVLDLKPKLLRLHVLIDNSGSMASLLPSVKMALMLLYGSMASLRNLFVRQMQETLNIAQSEAEEKFGLMTDVRISLFGHTSRTIKPYDLEDLSFLEEGRFGEKPPLAQDDREKIELLKAFSMINASEGTNDSQFWPALESEYAQNLDLQKHLKNNAMTDVLIQISDGEIPNSAQAVAATIDTLRSDYGLKVGGFAIGSDESALVDLGKRHGLDNVISAVTPDEIVRNFAEFLANTVREKIEKPYIDALKSPSVAAEDKQAEDQEDDE